MGNGASSGDGRSTVLVVDDDAKLREILGRVLRVGGYDVVDADSAEDALERLAEMRQRIAVVLTDLDMPGMGGEGLLAHIQRQWPSLPALVLTGGHRRVATLPAERQLAKPIAPDALLDAIGCAIRAVEIPSSPGMPTADDVHVVTLDADDLIDVDDVDDDPEMPSR